MKIFSLPSQPPMMFEMLIRANLTSPRNQPSIALIIRLFDNFRRIKRARIIRKVEFGSVKRTIFVTLLFTVLLVLIRIFFYRQKTALMFREP